jgi:hypothetical protein
MANTKPTAKREDREADIARRIERHSKVHLKMDDPLHDAERMAEVVLMIINDAAFDERNFERIDWAVNHLCGMVINLRRLYDDEPDDGAA